MEWTTIVAAIVGGIIASFSPILTSVLNARSERRRNILQSATNAAIEDFKTSAAASLASGGPVYPMSTYLYYHIKFLELADAGKLDDAAISELIKKRQRLLELYRELPAKTDAFMQ